MRLWTLMILSGLFILGCGKNGPVAYNGNPYMNNAPVPPMGGYSVPNGFGQPTYPYNNNGYPNYGNGYQNYGNGYPNNGNGYPNNGNGYPNNGNGYPNNGNGYPNYGNNFNPGMQTPYPSQSFYPYMPVYQWMQQNPTGQNYWNQMWNGWNQYCGQRGSSPYNFQQFWRQFLPQIGVAREPWYSYFNSQFYPWLSMNSRLPVSANPAGFWQHYRNAPYGHLNNYCQSYGCFNGF